MPRTAGRAAARPLVFTGIGGLAVGSVVVAVLHLVGPTAEISPIRRTISEYGLTDLAWVFNGAVLLVAAGSLAIVAAASRAGVATRAGTVIGVLWAAGLVTLVAFPKANWALGPSVSGQIHRAASLVAFIALPVAVTVVLRSRLSRGAPGCALARWAVGLAVLGLAHFTPVIVAIVLAGREGAWWRMVPLGLLERGMAVTEIAALVLLGMWVLGRAAATPLRAPTPAAGSAVRAGEPVPGAEPAPAVPVTDAVGR